MSLLALVVGQNVSDSVARRKGTVLGVPVSYFYEDAPDVGPVAKNAKAQGKADMIAKFGQTGWRKDARLDDPTEPRTSARLAHNSESFDEDR